MIDFTHTLDRLEVLAEHVPWSPVSKTRFFYWVTTTVDPSAAPTTFPHSLLPRRHLYTVSTFLFASVFLTSVMGLYGLLLVNTRPALRTVFLPNAVLRRTRTSVPAAVPMSTRTKQWIAFPFWCVLVGWPLLVRCENIMIQMGVALFAAWTGQRTLDLYFIQPWSGVGEMRRESYRGYMASFKANGIKEAEEEKKVEEEKEKEGEKEEVVVAERGLESIKGSQALDGEKEHGIRRRSVRLQLVRAMKSSRAATAAAAATLTAPPGEPKSVISEESRPLHPLPLPLPQILEEKRNTRRTTDAMVLNWDWDRFMIEMWLPMRKFSPSSLTSSSSRSACASSDSRSDSASERFVVGSDLFWTMIFHKFLIDWLVYKLSFVPSDWVESLGPVRYGVFVTATAALIMLMTLWPVRLAAWVYHRRYSHLPRHQKLNVEEWPMLGNPLPCFATTPVEFWLHWHTILRYIWVDLGFLPMQTLCRRVLTKERVGRTTARLAEDVMPVMAVFTLSGLLHAYVVMAVWRESGWSQMAYFWIQGIAVVVTKGVERSRVGGWIRRKRKGSKLTRMMLDSVGWTLMMGWHMTSVPLFVEPYLKSGMWLDIKELSPVWWIMTKVAP